MKKYAPLFDLSIIIVNYNSNSYLKKCINSIKENTFDIKYEIVVIDNHSLEPLDLEHYEGIRFIFNKRNMGFSYAINQGFKVSKGRYILALNPDTIIIDNALKKMITFMDQNKACGILGPKVYDKNNKVQYSRRTFPTFSTFFFNHDSLLTRYFPYNPWSKKYLLSSINNYDTREVDWVSGCCIMIRRILLEDIGLFDTQFFMYSEDVDICQRSKNYGWKIFYYPEAEIVHFMSGSSSHNKTRLIFERHKSIWRYYKKYLSYNPFLDLIAYFAVISRAILSTTFALVRDN